VGSAEGGGPLGAAGTSGEYWRPCEAVGGGVHRLSFSGRLPEAGGGAPGGAAPYVWDNVGGGVAAGGGGLATGGVFIGDL